MKTPDEIKKGMECCLAGPCPGAECPYFEKEPFLCGYSKSKDALAYIQQLEAANAELLTKVEQLEAENKSFMETIGLLHVTENQLETKCHQLEQERDAAVNELIGTCQVCRWEETEKCASCHFNSDAWNVCESNFEWRGAKEE